MRVLKTVCRAGPPRGDDASRTGPQAPSTAHALLRLERVSKIYPTGEVLRDVTWEVKAHLQAIDDPETKQWLLKARGGL